MVLKILYEKNMNMIWIYEYIKNKFFAYKIFQIFYNTLNMNWYEKKYEYKHDMNIRIIRSNPNRMDKLLYKIKLVINYNQFLSHNQSL